MSNNLMVIGQFDPAKAAFIEDGIRALVVALNTWPVIKTVGSCEGHDDPNKPNYPGVQFRGPIKLIEDLRKKIKGTNWTIRYGGKTAGFMMRPYKRQKSYLSVEGVAELVKMPDYDPKDFDHRLKTFIPNYIYNPKNGELKLKGKKIRK